MVCFRGGRSPAYGQFCKPKCKISEPALIGYRTPSNKRYARKFLPSPSSMKTATPPRRSGSFHSSAGALRGEEVLSKRLQGLKPLLDQSGEHRRPKSIGLRFAPVVLGFQAWLKLWASRLVHTFSEVLNHTCLRVSDTDTVLQIAKKDCQTKTFDPQPWTAKTSTQTSMRP